MEQYLSHFYSVLSSLTKRTLEEYKILVVKMEMDMTW